MRYSLILFLLLLLSISAFSQKTSSIVNEEEKFLQQFIGNWIGDGKSDNYEVQDEMIIEWTLDKRFLKIQYRSIKGDNYKGEGFIWFNKERKRYEYYEFNNGRWAVRQAIGNLDKQKRLVFNEKRPDIQIRLTFDFADSCNLKISEVEIIGKKEKTIAVLTFKKEPK